MGVAVQTAGAVASGVAVVGVSLRPGVGVDVAVGSVCPIVACAVVVRADCALGVTGSPSVVVLVAPGAGLRSIPILGRSQAARTSARSTVTEDRASIDHRAFTALLYLSNALRGQGICPVRAETSKVSTRPSAVPTNNNSPC